MAVAAMMNGMHATGAGSCWADKIPSPTMAPLDMDAQVVFHKLQTLVQEESNAAGPQTLRAILKCLAYMSVQDREHCVAMLRASGAASVAMQRCAQPQQPDIPTLVAMARDGRPDACAYAAKAMGDMAAESSGSRMEIAHAGGIAVLVQLVDVRTVGGSSSPVRALDVRTSAARALGNLALRCTHNQNAIMAAGGVMSLVQLAQELVGLQAGRAQLGLVEACASDTEGTYWVAYALANLAASNAETSLAIARLGGIAALVGMVRGGVPEVQKIAAKALGILAAHRPENAAAITQAGAIMPLVDLCREGTPEARRSAAAALGKLAESDADSRTAIIMAGGVAPLVALALDSSPEACRNAAYALGNIAAHCPENSSHLGQAGALAALARLAQDGPPEARGHAAKALEKFAMTEASLQAMLAAMAGA